MNSMPTRSHCQHLDVGTSELGTAIVVKPLIVLFREQGAGLVDLELGDVRARGLRLGDQSARQLHVAVMILTDLSDYFHGHSARASG
jgi:hypothetical protein